MTPPDFFAAFGISPYAVIAYALLHAHILGISRYVRTLHRRISQLEALLKKDPVNHTKVERMKELQNIPFAQRTPLEVMELDQLGRELAQRPELPDDPTTLLVDETRSPAIEGDGDYKRDAMARDVRETVQDVRAFARFVRFVVSLFRGGGR